MKLSASVAEKGTAKEIVEEALEAAKAYLISVEERLLETLNELKLSMTWSVALDTDVADALLATAELGEEKGPEALIGCDMIAMATHGYGGLERWVMGSVTGRILNATQLPMLVVRPHKEERVEAS